MLPCASIQEIIFFKHSDIVPYFLDIVIFYCANTTAFSMSDWKISEGVDSRDGTGQHFCSPAHPEVTTNRPAWTVYAKPQIISGPGRRP